MIPKDVFFGSDGCFGGGDVVFLDGTLSKTGVSTVSTALDAPHPILQLLSYQQTRWCCTCIHSVHSRY